MTAKQSDKYSPCPLCAAPEYCRRQGWCEGTGHTVNDRPAAPLPETQPREGDDHPGPIAPLKGDTPRTDAAIDRGECGPDFARQLERKLAEANRLLDDALHTGALLATKLETARLTAPLSAIPRSSGAYNWIKDASAALRAVNKAHPLDDKLFAQIQELLMGVPVPQEDLGFNSPADRAARSTTQERKA